MGESWAGKPSQVAPNWSGLTQAYMSSLPQILGTTAQGQSAADIAAAKSAAAISPMYNQTALAGLQGILPAMAAAGITPQMISQLGGAGIQTGIMQGQGVPQAQAYNAAWQAANPTAAALMGPTATQTANLLNSINLQGLTPAERAEVERSLGQSQTATGNLGLDNATNAVQNAMQFGSALQAKRTALGQALGTAQGIIQGTNTGYNPMSVMANAGQGNIGTQAFTPVTQSGNQAWNMAPGALGNLTGLTQTAMGQQYSAAMRSSPMGIGESISGQVGSVCCFIFLEALNGELPWWVRELRDRYYEEFPRIAAGYRRMARWLVPLMRRSTWIHDLVNRWMVTPIVQYGGYLMCVDGYDIHKNKRKYRDFWFTVWRIL
jgi:hypothetical protein